MTLGNGDANGSFAGIIMDNTSGTGTVALTKTGAGTQILSGSGNTLQRHHDHQRRRAANR